MLYRATQRAFQRYLSSQRRLVIEPVHDPFADLRHRYVQELRNVRGLSAATIVQHERTVSDFLLHALPQGDNDLRSVTSDGVDRYLAFKRHSVGKQRLQHMVAHLRGFLGFCRSNGEIDREIDVIDTVRVHGNELPPRALAWPSVLGLLGSINLSSRSGLRDYLILHLMAYYGLRPSEAVSLRLDSID